MAWTIPARPTVGDTDWNAEQEAIWSSLKSFVDGLETSAGGKNWLPGLWTLPGLACVGTSNEGTNANEEYIVPFITDAPGTVTDIGISVNVAGTGSARLGIYKKDASGNTWTLVNDAGTVTIASTGDKALTGLSIALTTPGIYGIAVLCQSACTLVARGSQMTPFGPAGGSLGNSNLIVFASQAQAYGALPASVTPVGQGSFGTAFNRAMVKLA